jgi:hypothetical protein
MKHSVNAKDRRHLATSRESGRGEFAVSQIVNSLLKVRICEIDRKRTSAELLWANEDVSRQAPSKVPGRFQPSVTFH